MLTNLYTYILFYFLIVCSTLGYGLAICSLSEKYKVSNNLGYIGLVGVFFLIIYSYFSSLFIAHGLVHNSIVVFLGLILFIVFIFFYKKNQNQDWYYFIGIFLILLIAAFIFKTHDDFPYYHFKYSYYLTQNSAFIGLGNFNLGFRTPSSIFYLNSLFYLPYVKHFMFQIPVILIMGFSNLILLIKLKKNILTNKINFITYFTLLVFIFINVFFYRLAEHGTDKSAQILVFILFIEILILTNFNSNTPRQISKIYIIMGLIISFKAFFILYGIFFLVIINHLRKKLEIKKIIKKFISNAYFISFLFLFLLIIFNNFINTGCLIYPVSLTCFESNIWSIRLTEVAELNDWYEQWSKAGAGPNFRVEDPAHYIQHFNWVGNWLDMYFFNKVSDYLLGLLLLSTIVICTFKSKQKNKNTRRKITLLLMGILVLLFEWFYNHPALRYGGYCLITSYIFIYTSTVLERFKLDKVKIKKKMIALICITFLIFISRNVNRILYEVNTYKYEPFKKVYYNISPEYFDAQNKFNRLIDAYESCNLDKKDCQKENHFKIKKIIGKYIFYIDR